LALEYIFNQPLADCIDSGLEAILQVQLLQIGNTHCGNVAGLNICFDHGWANDLLGVFPKCA
jgi:hypothetical protein